MDKFKFIAGTIGAVIVAYLILTATMPVITSLATAGAAEVATSTYIAEYTGAKEGLDYMPLVLYFVPGVMGVAAIVWKLKIQKGED